MLNTHPQIKLPERIVNNKPVVFTEFDLNMVPQKHQEFTPLFQNVRSKKLKTPWMRDLTTQDTTCCLHTDKIIYQH